MGGSKCAIPHCQNSYLTAKRDGRSDISFHRFPKNEIVRRKWIKQCKIGVKCTSSSSVCSDHFLPSDFVRNFQAELMGYERRKILRSDAVPSVNLIQSFSESNSDETEIELGRILHRNERLALETPFSDPLEDNSAGEEFREGEELKEEALNEEEQPKLPDEDEEPEILIISVSPPVQKRHPMEQSTALDPLAHNSFRNEGDEPEENIVHVSPDDVLANQIAEEDDVETVDLTEEKIDARKQIRLNNLNNGVNYRINNISKCHPNSQPQRVIFSPAKNQPNYKKMYEDLAKVYTELFSKYHSLKKMNIETLIKNQNFPNKNNCGRCEILERKLKKCQVLLNHTYKAVKF